jgi:hypothetical protein
MAVMRGAPSTRARYPIPRHINARSKVKKSRKNATVDLSVQRRRRNVKMNQPCERYVSILSMVEAVALHTIKKNPKESKNSELVGPPSEETI